MRCLIHELEWSRLHHALFIIVNLACSSVTIAVLLHRFDIERTDTNCLCGFVHLRALSLRSSTGCCASRLPIACHAWSICSTETKHIRNEVAFDMYPVVWGHLDASCIKQAAPMSGNENASCSVWTLHDLGRRHHLPWMRTLSCVHGSGQIS